MRSNGVGSFGVGFGLGLYMKHIKIVSLLTTVLQKQQEKQLLMLKPRLNIDRENTTSTSK
jgi:hypothetical protein